MGFWDFFKKKQVESEKIKFEDIENWLETKEKETRKKEEDYTKEVQEKINTLISELEQGLSTLNTIDINGKKAEDKIKLVVKENLENYIYYLEKLIINLKEVGENKEIIEKINSIFSDFEKRSSTSFEKATFLIGQELGNVKENIGRFFRDLKKIIKENQPVIDKSKAFSSIKEKLKKISEIKLKITEVEDSIKENKEKINNLDKKIKEKRNEIEDIKKTDKYIEEEKKIEKAELTKQEIEKQIDNLRESINFKTLANFFHSFEKEMSLVKAHKDNFKQEFKKTNGDSILNLLEESKTLNDKIKNKINLIKEKKQEIKNISFENLGIENIGKNIKELSSKIQLIKSESLSEQKRLEKMKANVNELEGSIKGELIKIDVETE